MPYCDHAATAPLLPAARDAMLDAMNLSISGEIGNASSLHSAGQRANAILEDARAEVAQLIHADPSEIIFTSGGSESNNTVMHIFAGQQIITSPLEHPSVLEPAKAYAGEYIKMDLEGTIAQQDIKEVLDGVFREHPQPTGEDEARDPRNGGRARRRFPEGAIKASLVSVMLANNELGTIFPIKFLAEQAHAHGAYFHSDATQALGKIPIDVTDLGVDYLTASAHKIGGPVGIGILYVKKGAPFKPLILGGHQEHDRRAGTSQIINAAGFAAAARHAREQQTWQLYEQQIRPLRDLLKSRILTAIPHAEVNEYPGTATIPHVLNISFPAAEGESTQLYLDLEGNIQVSTGSACASGDGQPSHVLMALTGGDAERAHGSIRFSLGLSATEQDIDHIMQHLPPIIQRLQGISTIKISSQPSKTAKLGAPA